MLTLGRAAPYRRSPEMAYRRTEYSINQSKQVDRTVELWFVKQLNASDHPIVGMDNGRIEHASHRQIAEHTSSYCSIIMNDLSIFK